METTKIGTKITFLTPVKKVYEVETDDKNFAVAMALDTIARKYPSLTDKPTYNVEEYTYTELTGLFD